MKKKLLFIASFLVFISSYSQKEFWGLTSIGGTVSANYGTIFKTDFNGANAEIVHFFDSANGMKPYGRLFQASNGKLYGTASQGGYTIPNSGNTGGVLFEYDLILNRFRIVTFFGSPQLPNRTTPESGVIEPIAGNLFGSTSSGGIYKYNITNESTVVSGTVPNINGSIQNPITGELLKASNGYIYGTTLYSSSCSSMPLLGSIVRLDPSNNNFNFIYPFNCTSASGKSPTGSLVEGATGKLYGTTWGGGTDAATGFNHEDGVLFEYDINTNTYTKKIDFNRNTTGSYPGPLTIGGNNKLYGLLGNFGKDPSDPDPNNVVKGSLYEYNITTNTVTVLHYFSDMAPNVFPFSIPRGTLLKASDGNLYGIDNGGVFKFDPATNVLTRPTVSNQDYFYPNESGDLIEICRKPSYHYFDTASFTACKETAFTFDVQNTNATTYLWNKNGSPLPGQNTAVLTLPNLALTDSGTYTCEMINECGITVTMPLQLTVEPCLGLDEAIGRKNAITIYPNPATTVLNLKLPDNTNFEIQDITIRNMLGQTVYTNSKEFLQVNTSTFSSGIYLLELTTDKGNWSTKFIKK